MKNPATITTVIILSTLIAFLLCRVNEDGTRIDQIRSLAASADLRWLLIDCSDIFSCSKEKISVDDVIQRIKKGEDRVDMLAKTLGYQYIEETDQRVPASYVNVSDSAKPVFDATAMPPGTKVGVTGTGSFTARHRRNEDKQ